MEVRRALVPGGEREDCGHPGQDRFLAVDAAYTLHVVVLHLQKQIVRRSTFTLCPQEPFVPFVFERIRHDPDYEGLSMMQWSKFLRASLEWFSADSAYP